MSLHSGKFNQAIDDFQLSPVSAETDAQLEKDSAGPARGGAPERQFCVFRCGRERFCLPVLDVEEVVEWPLVTRVPLGPAYLMGIFNLRGTIVPLVDIAMTEGRRPGLLPRHVVVASYREGGQQDDMRIGIATDEVIGTFSAASDAMLERGPDNVPHCVGLLRHDDRLALTIDLRRLLEVFPGPAI